MRRTQRAPKSCMECSSRKIKCDQVIPCKPCTKRGQGSRCNREMVLVRGRATVIKDESPHRVMQDLMEENRRLRELISNSSPSSMPATVRLPSRTLSIDETINHPQKLMAMVFPNQFVSLVHTWDDIFLPNRWQSNQLIQHGKVWTSWIHCAVYYREFEAAHEEFWDFLESGGIIKQRNPSWLAIYFGLLATAILTSDESMESTMLPRDDVSWMMRNWYSASLFCLEKADYMRSSNMMHVQAICILQMCSNAVGDIIFRNRIMAMGVQIANDIGMPFQVDMEHSLIHSEYSRRMWWVFVICEWFTPATYQPSISESDFDVVLPLPFNDENLESGQIPAEISQDIISPWWYHVNLCKTALVHHRFIHAVRLKEIDLETLVRKADEGLANVIDNLPPHLQQYGEQSFQHQYLEEQYPWIKWQRIDLTTTLFLWRSKINYECRQYWSESPPTSLARRVLCLESAQSVITLLESADMPIHQRRYMTYTLRLYSAGLIIASEIPRSINNDDETTSLLNSLLKCIQLLDQSRDLNVVAERAVEHLNTFVKDLSRR